MNRMKQAFTLIEMLLVVVIILVLGLLLYPAFNKTRESARGVRCSSNLKQLHMAAMSYTSDGYTPSATTYWYQSSDGSWYLRKGWIAWYTWTGMPDTGPRSTKPGDSDRYDWQDATAAKQGTKCITNGVLWAYAKHQDIYVCPTHKMRSGSSKAVRSYSMNGEFSYQNYFAAQQAGSMRILFAEDRFIESSPWDGLMVTNEVATWHGGKGNAVYLDGHIERQ